MPHNTNSPLGNDPILEPIAICGMACHLPGAVDSASSLWDMLIKKETGQTAKVPESRFNIDAHYHSNLERPGSFNVLGGYFLDGKPEDFDPTAFNMTPIEAQWLDPQQRKLLEVSYECLESAGLSLDSVAGSSTAVFVGSFTSDYQQMSIRDPDFRHNYAATGVDPGIISNRIGNVFNLKGPSFTINTACSSSIYAIHNACHALRAGDCDAALAGGVNLILTVDQHMNTAKLGILSPTSTCHTFDASADGYGRAEGAGVLYLKRLQDAMRDGDPVRGVIRSTAVNTNGKVEGMGITHPSVRGQEAVVRMAYEKANLDPSLTAYAELHGTGTPVGDPIEGRATSNAMNDTRSPERPLLLGAIKPNIGHSEAASGIFAVMKAAMMTESGVLPGVANFEKLNPAIHEQEWNVKVNSNTIPWPKEFDIHRASVSSFGYGGTNGHVIVESVKELYPSYQHAKSKRDASYVRSFTRPFLLCFSAHDKVTLSRNVAAISKVAEDYYLSDLAYTLNMNRTRWAHRGFTIARENQESAIIDTSTIQSGVAFQTIPEAGFLFTGQGAQWAGMGQKAIREFPLFLHTIQKLDRVLTRLNPAQSFNLETILLDDVDIISKTINDAEVAQPLCTVIQIALVDLFAEWNITPSVSMGHSSGEIGAAYAAGLISAPEAIFASYCRGLSVKEHSASGSMLAVGLGAEEVAKYLSLYTPEQLCIACENSPGSVTLSGLPEYVDQIKTQLDDDKVFARELMTGRAYHSPHMASVGAAYDQLLPKALSRLTEDDLSWRRPRTPMISSVTGKVIEAEVKSLPSSYWSQNLRSRVLFNTAVEVLGSDPDFKDVKSLVEIGPHSALSGPFKQICIANKFDQYRYIPSLLRNKNDVDQMLSVAGALFIANYPVDLEAVNFVNESKTAIGFRKPKSHQLLVDLPPYQWNYEKNYWAEPRASAEQRNLTHARHDLLGSKISGLSSNSPVWRNVLRHRDIPWLRDHALGGTAIFPAAGHVSLAVEALRQICEDEGLPFEQVSLRDVDITTALVVPDTDSGVEIQLSLEGLQEPASDTSVWYSFSVDSLFEGGWISHCRGKISTSIYHGLGTNRGRDASQPSPVDCTRLTERVPGKRWYEAFQNVGFDYGPTFQQLGQVRTDRGCNEAEGEVMVLGHSGTMQDESRYVIHPSTIDACLQLIIISIHGGDHKEMPWGVVPIRMEEITLHFPIGDEGSNGSAVAWTDSSNGRYFNTHTQLMGKSGKLLVDIKSLRCVAYEAALPAGASDNAANPAPFSTVSWKPDILTLKSSSYSQLWPTDATEAQRLGALVKLINFRQPIGKVLLCGQPKQSVIDAVSSVLPTIATVVVGSIAGYQAESNNEGVVRKPLPENSSDWSEALGDSFDIVIADDSVLHDQDAVKLLVKKCGWLIFSIPGDRSTMNGAQEKPILEVPFWDPEKGARQIQLVSTDTNLVTTIDHHHLDISAIHDVSEDEDGSLIGRLIEAGHTVESKILDELNYQSIDGAVLIDDRTGGLLDSLNYQSFEGLKSLLSAGLPTVWLTKGVRQGASVHGGMVQGFLRVIRSEQAAVRIVLLDADLEEKVEDISDAIVGALTDVPTKDSGKETELWLHQGILHIGRVFPNSLLNYEWAPSNLIPAKVESLPKGVRLTSTVEDGQPTFTPQKEQPSELNPHGVEIQVTASEMQTVPDSPIVVAGTVLRHGSFVNEVSVGEQVVAFAIEQFPTIIQTPIYARIDLAFDNLETLTADLSALSKVANICLTTARIRSGDRILALPGPTSTLQTLARVAQALQWDLRLVVESETEQQEYITKLNVDSNKVLLSTDWKAISANLDSDDGRSVVIAHNFSGLSQEVWRHVPSLALFILNESNLETAPDALPFTRGASFVPTRIKTLDSVTTFGVLKQALSLLQENTQLAGHLAAVHDIGDVDQVNEVVHHLPPAKIGVVNYRYNESQVKVKPKPKLLSFSPDASYLLVGCLGGLGRSLTRFMMERGARNFAFISRSGDDKPEAAHIVNQLRTSGASIQVFRADAASKPDVARIVQEVNTTHPIRGVVHAAMVLKDGVFEQMDYESFKIAIDPKVRGALSLSEALQGVDLDFFVMTSSISATLGNPGQSNYSAANSFLDTLALQHRLQNRAGVSLVLPMVLDVGVVAENASMESSLLRKGMYGIDEHEMLRGFEVAMSRSVTRDETTLDEVGDTQIILGLEPTALAKAVNSEETIDAYWYDDARFAHLRAEVEAITQMTSSSTKSGSGGLATLLKSVASSSPDEIISAIAEYIAKRVGSILLIAPGDFELNGPSIASYGLDSMIGAEMRNWLFKEFGLDYSFQELLSPSLTFNGLAGVVAGHLKVLPEN